ncbi:MAG: DUF1320 domain-containing protein [Thermodesulfobacteriota bacterium]
MSYCTQDDILEQIDETALIELTDDDGVGAVDAARVTRAIADADADIDAYCQAHYSVPLSPVPPKVRKLAVDIAIYHLYSRRGDAAPDIRKDRYRDAVRFLEKVAAGDIALGVASPAPESGGAEFISPVAGSPPATRIFTRDTMKDLK